MIFVFPISGLWNYYREAVFLNLPYLLNQPKNDLKIVQEFQKKKTSRENGYKTDIFGLF